MYFFVLQFEFSICIVFWACEVCFHFDRIIGAIRPMVCSEVLGHPISVCHSKLFKYNQNDRSVKTQQYYIQ